MEWIFDTATQWFSDTITGSLDVVTTGFLDIFGMDIGVMTSLLPIFTGDIAKIIQNVALALVIIFAALKIFLNFFVKITDKHESGFHILFKMVIAYVMAFYAYAIMDVIYRIAKNIYKMFMTVETSELGTFSGLADVMTTANTDNLYSDTIISIIVIFLIITIAFNYLKLMLEATERFVVYCLLYVCSPLGFSTYVINETSGITTAYVRMAASELALMIFNVIFIKGSTNAIGNFLTSSAYIQSRLEEAGSSASSLTAMMFTCLFIIAFLKVGQRVDTYMKQLGLNSAQTGSDLVGEVITATGNMGKFGRTMSGIGKTIGKAGGIVGASAGLSSTGSEMSAASASKALQDVSSGAPVNPSVVGDYVNSNHFKGNNSGNEAMLNKHLKGALDDMGATLTNVNAKGNGVADAIMENSDGTQTLAHFSNEPIPGQDSQKITAENGSEMYMTNIGKDKNPFGGMAPENQNVPLMNVKDENGESNGGRFAKADADKMSAFFGNVPADQLSLKNTGNGVFEVYNGDEKQGIMVGQQSALNKDGGSGIKDGHGNTWSAFKDGSQEYANITDSNFSGAKVTDANTGMSYSAEDVLEEMRDNNWFPTNPADAEVLGMSISDGVGTFEFSDGSVLQHDISADSSLSETESSSYQESMSISQMFPDFKMDQAGSEGHIKTWNTANDAIYVTDDNNQTMKMVDASKYSVNGNNVPTFTSKDGATYYGIRGTISPKTKNFTASNKNLKLSNRNETKKTS